MKQIGYTSTDRQPTSWGPNFTAGPIQLFIPEPGTRENVNADAFQHIGWINPDQTQTPLGAEICQYRDQAGPDSRPAYIKRQVPIGFDDGPAQSIRAGSGFMLTESMELPTKLVMRGIHDTAEPDCIECGAAVDEHWDCCKTHAATAPVSRAEFEALVLRVDAISASIAPPAPAVQAEPHELVLVGYTGSYTLDGLRHGEPGNIYPHQPRSGNYIPLYRLLPPAPAVQAEPPMTFYDHAFIHAAINHRHYYGDEGVTVALIEDAHKVAGELTRNRANQP